MKKTTELSTEERISDKIASFVQKYKDSIIAFCVLIVLLIVVVVIAVSATTKSREKAQYRIDELQQRYDAFEGTLTSDEYEQFKKDLEKQIKGKRYPSVKAAYLLGLTQYDMGKYDEAVESFEKCYKLNSDIYLSPLALVNAGASAENAGNLDKAIELYTMVLEFEESGAAPKAAFNLGRIYMQQGKSDLAKSNFQLLADNYPYSEYTKLAQAVLDLM